MHEEIVKGIGEHQTNGSISKETALKLELLLKEGKTPDEEMELAKILLEAYKQNNLLPELDKNDPARFGHPFHNPYTFIPVDGTMEDRTPPTPLTIDEVEKDRFTGVLDLEIELLSPLLSSDPNFEKYPDNPKHHIYSALRIDDDVVLPATGVRGALRTLMTVLTSGTLGHIDEEAYLCQDRDKEAYLGPVGHDKNPEIPGPGKQYLGEVVCVGGIGKPGKIRLGETRLEFASKLQECLKDKFRRPTGQDRSSLVWVDEACTSCSIHQDEKHVWRVKLSGEPIGQVKKKREGLFRPGSEEDVIDVPWELWAAYNGRHRHADFPFLKVGDLVWLERKDIDGSGITSADDIASLQWARWGRHGKRLLDLVNDDFYHILPDEINPDGLVDEVTNLFGQVPREDLCNEAGYNQGWKEQGKPGPATSFAGRVRPGNLVFENGAQHLVREHLPVLNSPKPGCLAFYRTPGNAPHDQAARKLNHKTSKLRGYKVYRTTKERGKEAPWKYNTQPSFTGTGEADTDPYQNTNVTVELLPEKRTNNEQVTGKLKITLRALSPRELSLVLALCTVDWRLGGGKPLGLGHSFVRKASLRELQDDGTISETEFVFQEDSTSPRSLPKLYEDQLGENLRKRLNIWQASQNPVTKLRYPRAMEGNGKQNQRGGHLWFKNHATPQKTDRGGITDIRTSKKAEDPLVQNVRMRGQPLPEFNEFSPESDILYGYDLMFKEVKEPDENQKMQNTVKSFVSADSVAPRKDLHPGKNWGQDGDSRSTRRKER